LALKCLTIEFEFDANGAERFVNALSRNETLTKLAFDGARFYDDAISVFVDYLKTRNVTKGFSELLFTGCFFGIEGAPCFQGERIAQFVNGPCGAGVKTLCVNTFASWNGLWSGMNAAEMNNSRMLQCIKLPTVKFSSDEQLEQLGGRATNEAMVRQIPDLLADMMRLLPDLLYLRELWFGEVPCDVNTFVDAMKKNSSLHEVVFTDDVAPFDQWDVVKRLLEGFGQRNANLPALLVDFEQLESDGLYTSSLEDSTIHLLPELFIASRQTPRLAPTYMLAALLASFEKVGPPRRINRAAL
jgi:hypothetical protein